MVNDARRFVFALVVSSLFGPFNTAFGAFDDDEPLLYPAGFPTADVLRKSEKLFAPQGWASYGVTPHLTATVDWFATVFGVPAGYVRYQVPSEKKTKYAFEFYALEVPGEITVNRYDDFDVEHKGATLWLHAMQSMRLTPKLRMHSYVGATYDQYQRYIPKDHHFEENTREDYFTPDVGIGFEQTINTTFKININASYGNTFYYFDQDPRKYMLVYGLSFAPFSRRLHPFWANLRLEINGMWAYLPDPNYHFFTVPFFPILLWQWGG